MHLKEEEQVERYRNMLLEYEQLKKDLSSKADCLYSTVARVGKKKESIEMKYGDFSLKRARELVLKGEY